MKRPTIDDAQRHADAQVVRARHLLKKDVVAEIMPELIARKAELARTHGWVKAIWLDDDRLDTEDSPLDTNVMLEIVAGALERGELPSKHLAVHAAEVLRQVIRENIRGNLFHRDRCIAGLLMDLRSWGFPLFPNRAGRRAGQTYGCDIVVAAFEKVDLELSVATVEQVWKCWSRSLAHVPSVPPCT